MIKIDSVASYISEISKINTLENLFFRGQSNDSYDLVPGIYRKGDKEFTHLINESVMYRDIISKSPSDFNNKNTLESLTLMQHYGLPTRILDITSNALVALYFACCNNFEKNGKVYVFNVEKDSIVNYNSDRACILANLSKLNHDFYYSIRVYEQVLNYKNKIVSELENIMEEYFELMLDHNDINQFIKKNIVIKTNENYLYYLSKQLVIDLEYSIKEKLKRNFTNINVDEKYIQVLILFRVHSIISEELDKIINIEIDNVNKIYFQNLIDFIKEDKPYFYSRIDPIDIGKILLVKPKLDNARIVRQQGAFFIFGVLKGTKKLMPTFNENWIIRELIINNSSKCKILRELELLGISEITLFPEIDYVAKHIRNKYSV